MKGINGHSIDDAIKQAMAEGTAAKAELDQLRLTLARVLGVVGPRVDNRKIVEATARLVGRWKAAHHVADEFAKAIKEAQAIVGHSGAGVRLDTRESIRLRRTLGMVCVCGTDEDYDEDPPPPHVVDGECQTCGLKARVQDRPASDGSGAKETSA